MKSLFNKSIIIILALVAVSCADENSPNYHYFPDMAEPVPYEPYGDYEIFPNRQEAMIPASGTVPRGWMPYEYENTTEGFQAAKTELKNPLPYTEANLAAGRQLYTIYCAVCHGDQGDGQGILVQREKILGIPRYDDQGRDITEGSVYHVMYYGLNAMGSYASQTTINERWLIDHYVMKLKNDLLGGEEREFDEEPGDSIFEGPMENLIPAVNTEEDQVSEEEETIGAYEEEELQDDEEQDNQN